MPPLLKGGQGRSADQIERDGVPSVLTLLALLVVVVTVLARWWQ